MQPTVYIVQSFSGSGYVETRMLLLTKLFFLLFPLNQLQEQKDVEFRTFKEHLSETINRHERERLEDMNQIKMLKADLSALNSER